jgi:hypothetical protein
MGEYLAGGVGLVLVAITMGALFAARRRELLLQRRQLRLAVAARRGAAHFGVVLDQMAGLQPVGGTTLLSALHDAAERIRQRALVVVLSDFFVAPVELKSAIQHLRWLRNPQGLRAWWGGFGEGLRTSPGGRQRLRVKTTWRMWLAGRAPFV